jgi:hypothetical protein
MSCREISLHMIGIALRLVIIVGASGCEYAFSDVATRIRYRLLAESASLRDSSNETAVVAMQPDHWPDQCRRGQGYRLVLSPYKGGKQVATGDIVVNCKGGGSYYTGMGSENVYVAREMWVEKKNNEELRMTLRKTSAGVEIVSLD